MFDYVSNFSTEHGCFAIMVDTESWTMPDPADGLNNPKQYLHTAKTYRLFDVDANREIAQYSMTKTDNPWFHQTHDNEIDAMPMECSGWGNLVTMR